MAGVRNSAGFQIVPDDEDLIDDSLHVAEPTPVAGSNDDFHVTNYSSFWATSLGVQLTAIFVVLIGLNILAWQRYRPVIEQWRYSKTPR